MRHVPKTKTSECELLSFEEALLLYEESAEGFDAEKWIYVPPFYSEYRYVLGTRGKNPLIVIGVNPSTASPDALDPTLKSAQRIAKLNGYDSFWMINVYPQRATDPDDMERKCNGFLQQQNLSAFKNLLQRSQSKDVWCAWGNVIDKRSFLKSCVSDILQTGNKFGANWLQAEKTCKSGNPHHPLYLKAETKLIPHVPKVG